MDGRPRSRLRTAPRPLPPLGGRARRTNRRPAPARSSLASQSSITRVARASREVQVGVRECIFFFVTVSNTCVFVVGRQQTTQSQTALRSRLTLSPQWRFQSLRLYRSSRPPRGQPAHDYYPRAQHRSTGVAPISLRSCTPKPIDACPCAPPPYRRRTRTCSARSPRAGACCLSHNHQRRHLDWLPPHGTD